MKTIDEIINKTLDIEGGLVDHESDGGGITNHGVSLRYAKGVGLDLDGDGDTDGDDIRLVDIPTARKLFKKDFLYDPGIHRMPSQIIPQVFDCAVNHGPARAIMFVQRVLIEAGFLPAVDGGRPQDDGVIGRKTLRAAENAQAEMGVFFNNAIMFERIRFFHEIVERDASQGVFLKGWLRRAREFEMEV